MTRTVSVFTNNNADAGIYNITVVGYTPDKVSA